MRVLVVGAACAGLSAVGVTGASASHESFPAVLTAQEASRTQLSPGPGAQLWVARYGTTEFEDTANAVQVSPGGGTVFVTGSTDPPSGGGGLDYATVAYNASTGAQLWLASYNDPYGLNDYATSLAVSPSGETVYVTGPGGYENGGVSSYDYTTIAYNAATGGALWVARYNGPGNSDDRATSVTLSRSGGTVYVTGYSSGTTSGYDYATVAYNAATGAQLWAKRYNGPGNSDDRATSVGVSPNGKRVFTTGYSTGKTSGDDYATVAYNATTGAQLWVKRYNGPGNGDDSAFALAVSPTDGALYVTGGSASKGEGPGYATVAYNVATGAQLWVKRYNGPATLDDSARSIAVSPGGGTLFVTGQSVGTKSNYDYATIAYKATTGTRLWVKRYNGPGNSDDRATSAVVSPGGNTVYVTGESPGTSSGYDYATIAYSATSGARLWVARLNGTGNGNDTAQAAAVSPTTGTVFVTGSSAGTGTMEIDYATVAYHG